MSSAQLLDQLLARVTSALPPEEIAQLKGQAAAEVPRLRWIPNPGPQTRAYYCEADELLFGGEAGGGKSDLLIGLGLNEHKRSRILRRINQDVVELGERLLEILGDDTGYRSAPPTWHGRDGQMIEFRGCELERDKQRFKGKARDLIGYDELADFLESQYVFINTWNRSVDPDQRCRIVGATNGPTTAEGMWIVKRWAAWLDPKHPNPAKDGELRWYLTIDGQDVEVDGPGPHEVRGKTVRATSRTFIRSRLEDNPDLAATDYGDRLEALPEELRRVYREGDFTLGLKDDDWQVIPTAWIEAAMQRRRERPPEGYAMTAMAVDVAPGGGDKRVIAARYGGWYADLDVARQVDPDGRLTAGAVVRLRRDNCPVIVDLGGGWGGDAAIALRDNGIVVVTYLGVGPSVATARDKKLRFVNLRAESIWKFREALDPEQEGGSPIELPNDPELKADLASFRWTMTPNGIKIEDKEALKKRIGRSPDRGEAVVMCLSEGAKAQRRMLDGGLRASGHPQRESVNPNRSRYSRFSRREGRSHSRGAGGGEQG
jgi:hypothetical protein